MGRRPGSLPPHLSDSREPRDPLDAEDLSTIVARVFDPSVLSRTRFDVTVVAGVDRGLGLSVDASLPSAVLVGQSPLSGICLTDREVSRRHASLQVVGRRLQVKDLESKNGTFVNGLAIAEAYLTGGEELRLGATTLRVELGAERDAPASQVPLQSQFGRVFGASLEMRRLYPLLERLAASDVPLILEGETGTGKELVAEAIHEQGPRASAPFIVFDCTTVLPALVESELFGHERGAFTGAVSQRKGLFEQADGGTLFIDEIGDLDPSLQPKLLRALERSETRRVGGDRWFRFNVRVISATRRDLDREVAAGRFRDDLYHRLAVARVELPPLRERKGDLSQLAGYFWKSFGGRAAPPALLARWETERWPGNVRELRNTVARHVALGDLAAQGFPQRGGSVPPPRPREPLLAEADTTDVIEQVIGQRLPLIQGRQAVVAEYERRYIDRILRDHHGDIVQASQASGIARRHFQRIRARRSQG